MGNGKNETSSIVLFHVVTEVLSCIILSSRCVADVLLLNAEVNVVAGCRWR